MNKLLNLNTEQEKEEKASPIINKLNESNSKNLPTAVIYTEKANVVNHEIENDSTVKKSIKRPLFFEDDEDEGTISPIKQPLIKSEPVLPLINEISSNKKDPINKLPLNDNLQQSISILNSENPNLLSEENKIKIGNYHDRTNSQFQQNNFSESVLSKKSENESKTNESPIHIKFNENNNSAGYINLNQQEEDNKNIIKDNDILKKAVSIIPLEYNKVNYADLKSSSKY